MCVMFGAGVVGKMQNETQDKKSFLTWPLFLVTLGHLTTDLGQGALPILLPFVRESFGLTYTQIGVVVLVQNFTSSIIQPLFGYITDKIYLPWLLPGSILLASLGISLTGHASSYYWLLAAVVAYGLGSASFHPQASVSINYISKNSSRGKSMGTFSVGGNLGFSLGSVFMVFLLAQIGGGMSNTSYFLLPGLFTTVLIMANLKKVTPAAEQLPQKKGAASAGIPWRMLGVLLLFIFFRSTVHTGLQTYIPLYYINYLGENPVYASYLVSLFLLGGALGTFIGASLSDRWGRKMVIVTSMSVSLPLILLVPHVSGAAALAVVFIAGGTLVSSFATTLVLAQEMMPDNVGMASGLTVGFSIGLGGLGATILGMIADSMGLPAVMTVLGLSPVLGLLTALLLPGKLFIGR